MTPTGRLFAFDQNGIDQGAIDLVGGKAFGLMRMSEAGIHVPPGFVLSTDICREYYERGGALPTNTRELLNAGMSRLEAVTHKSFGGDRKPLLVAVRSGAPASMPGMLETLLNVGLSHRTVPGFIRTTGNPRFVWDSYRRLVQSYAEIVDGCSSAPFNELAERITARSEVPVVGELDVAALKELTEGFLVTYQRETGVEFPQDAPSQLLAATEAVIHSWAAPKARSYYEAAGLQEARGTAVTVQAMVFGNIGGASGAGVGFSRNPATGDDHLYIDFVLNGQGEDVVSGRASVQDSERLLGLIPGLLDQLRVTRRQLERLFLDVQDFEFTVENSRLFILQARNAKRTPWAALRIACDFVDEGLINEAMALERLEGVDLDGIHRTKLGEDAPAPIARGTPASPGVAAGRLVLRPDRLRDLAGDTRPVILVRQDVVTEDIACLRHAAGLLAQRGARTSHAAVVARQYGKPCVVGCRTLSIEPDLSACRLGEKRLLEGTAITIDGSTGEVYEGGLQPILERPLELVARVKTWKTASGRRVGRALPAPLTSPSISA